MRKETVLRSAQFDQKLLVYWMTSSILFLVVCLVTIPIAPFWLIFGWAFHRKQLERLECQLTERSLNVRKGVLFRSEKNVPLDKIQDVGLKEGPILRWLGLSALSIETAGGSGQERADAHLVGVVDAPTFRDAILDQRDLVVERMHSGGSAPTAAAAEPSGSEALLREMRDSLLRIEERLSERG